MSQFPKEFYKEALDILREKLKIEIDENLYKAYFEEEDIIKKYFKWTRKADEFYEKEIENASEIIGTLDMGKMVARMQVEDRGGAFLWKGLDKENPLDDLAQKCKEDPKYMLTTFMRHCDRFNDYFTETIYDQLTSYYKKNGTYDADKNYYEEISEMDYDDFYNCKAFGKHYKDYFYLYKEAQEIIEFVKDKLKSVEKKEEMER
ncbi:MAG: hypothetical protein IJE04_05155 [Bacilli bacterium]|nr:hypothetical protein [Bacilli bacterium]